MGQPYPSQLADKQAHAEQLLAPFDVPEWLPPVASGERDYRNKAKMVVGGTADAWTCRHAASARPGTVPRSPCSPGSSRSPD